MFLGSKIVPSFKLLVNPDGPKPVLATPGPDPVVGVVTRGEPPLAVVTVGMPPATAVVGLVTLETS